nr:hypothetical protein [Tanacetum cinerariifolium]
DNRLSLLGPQDILSCLLFRCLAGRPEALGSAGGLRLRLEWTQLCIGDSLTVASDGLYANDNFRSVVLCSIGDGCSGERSLLEHKMSKLEDQLVKAQKNKDVKGSQVVKDLRSENAHNLEELSMLRMVVASAEESRKNLSEELVDLQTRLKEAFDEVHELKDSCDFKDVQDYHHEAKKIFDEVAEDFYKLKFPYISLLGEKAGLSLEELAVVEAPSVQEAPPS